MVSKKNDLLLISWGKADQGCRETSRPSLVSFGGKKPHSTALALRDVSCMSKRAELSNRKARIHVKSAEDAEDAKGLERPLTRLTSFLLMGQPMRRLCQDMFDSRPPVYAERDLFTKRVFRRRHSIYYALAYHFRQHTRR